MNRPHPDGGLEGALELIRPDILAGLALRQLVCDWEKSATAEVVAALAASIGQSEAAR